ncbi:MAG: carbohydrate ABC transporter permease [bacterium]
MKIVKGVAGRYKWTALGFLVVLILLAPVYFIATFGFETVQEMFHVPPYLFPPKPTLEAFRNSLRELLPYMKNSLIVAFGCLLLTLLVAPPAAYSLAHFNPRVSKYIISLLALTQMFPVVMIAIPLFLIYNRLGLINTYLGLILVDATYSIPFCTLVLSAYMRSVPFELVESATIDGASPLGAFLRVVVPIVKPGIATAGAFGFLFAWADFIYALTMTTKASIQPMSVGLYKYIGIYGILWNRLMAGGFIFSIPALAIVTFAGRFVVAGLTAGALRE